MFSQRFPFTMRGLRRGLWGVLILVLSGVAAWTVWTWNGQRPRQGGEERPLEGLQVFGTIPDFSLVERSGRRVGLSDLRGKVWVATFFFSRCQATCPLQTAQMARLQADLAGAPDLRLVSITIDPGHDTPEVLARYAARHGADPGRWLFLTGEGATISRLATAGFRLSVGDAAAPSLGARGPVIPHSSRLVLVDRVARIRGYYPGIEADALQRLRRDVTTLLRDGR